MNPYDFVPIDWNNPSKRRSPAPHNKFSGVSGKIEGTITAKTPLFIFPSPKQNDGSAEPFIRNDQNQHIIPGSSLKGLFRNLVEAIGNGCFLLFDGNYEYDKKTKKYKARYKSKLPNDFKKCHSFDHLCIACRMFGMTQGANQLLLGKVSFNDAVEVKIHKHQAIYTVSLLEPKPRHQAFYLDPTRKCVAGRKFYFHQPHGLPNVDEKRRFNQHIKPVGPGSQFAFSLQFTNLEKSEFQTLLYALNLEPGMCHKIGYGKPSGLGSVRFDITKLTLINFANRYKKNQGLEEYTQNSGLAEYLLEETDRFTSNTKSQTLEALRRIWRWNPNGTTVYCYPSRDWFRKNRPKRIKDTL